MFGCRRKRRTWRGLFEVLEPRHLMAISHVIQISVDGLGSHWLEPLLNETGNAAELPNFQRLVAEGTSSTNARTDFTHTVTLPNHASMITGRPVLAPRGKPSTVSHNWTSNSDPPIGVTLHSNQPDVDYLASVFDVVHDRGGSTALFAGKGKFSLFDVSYDAQHGAVDLDTASGDNGRDKVDVYYMHNDSRQLVDRFTQELAQRQFTYSFLHLADPDSAGHQSGWGSDDWNAAVEQVDGYLGKVLKAVESNGSLKGTTAILLTADHGGSGKGHDNPGQLTNYQIPFFLWGPEVPAGANLYDVFSAVVADPQQGRPDYNAPSPPVRNGDSGNVALALLGYPPIPDSMLTVLHSCIQPTGIGCRKDPNEPQEYDFGDAPLPYPTSKTLAGARHKIEVGFHLGSAVDSETDGQPDLQATGDDLQGDDEDGVVFTSAFQPGATAALEVTASQPGNLQAWIDWNRDGDWADPDEHVLQDVALVGGVNQLTLAVPSSSASGMTMARFRFAHEKGLSWTGLAEAGEVEDYALLVEDTSSTVPLEARDDAYRVPSGTRDLILYVLANDRGTGRLTIRAVTTPDRGGQVRVGADSTSLRYSTGDGSTGLESFTYEVQDEAGQCASARVTVDVEPRVPTEQQVKLRLEVVGPTAEPTTELRIGDAFWLVVYVQDVRPSGSGVAAAYVDVPLDSQAVAAAGPIEFGASYAQATSGRIDPGRVDEAGGQTSVSWVGTDEQLLFRAPLKARWTGSLVFSLDAADQAGHEVRLLGSPDSVPAARWLFDPLTVTIVSLTNVTQPLDVNGDGWVTPFDALLVINDLNRSGPRSLADTDDRPRHLVDVNGDMFASSIDALLVINHLNTPTPPAASPAEGEAVDAVGEWEQVGSAQSASLGRSAPLLPGGNRPRELSALPRWSPWSADYNRRRSR